MMLKCWMDRLNKTALVFSLVILVVIGSTVCLQAADAESYTLDNGMTVILKPVRGVPMVSSVVFVKSGSRYESRYENGITHFLEHLLFDGTTSKSRADLDDAIKQVGGYINAFTRKDITAYFVLAPSQFLDVGLTVQADMLFNSIFPEQEMAKERRVVIEEIRQSADAPGAAAERFFIDHAYAGTDYQRPVLGYEAFIENIPREAVIDYWKRFYRPANMTLMIIGEFDAPAAKKTVEEIFGGVSSDSSLPSDNETRHEALAEQARSGDPITGQQVFDTVAAVASTYIGLSIAGPPVLHEDYLPLDLLARYLEMPESSPLHSALLSGDSAPATELSVSLVPREGFSRLEISVISDRPDATDSIIAKTGQVLSTIAEDGIAPSTLAGIQTTARTEAIYNSSRLHYYGFLIAPLLATGGWDFIQEYGDRVAQVTSPDCKRAARQWLDEPRFVATIVRPVGESDGLPYTPKVVSADEVLAYFDTAAFVSYQTDSGVAVRYPESDSVRLEYDDRSDYVVETLANGMQVIVKSTPDQPVFAATFLGRNRSANEPENLAGITDFVNHMLEKGTRHRSAQQLADDLAAIGAQTTLYDNPWIPYDDHYTSRSHSFLKFETIDEYAETGFDLFAEMVFEPSFDSAAVEEVRRSLMAVAGRNATQPRVVARQRFYRELFVDHPFGKPLTGTPKTLSHVATADLVDHHRRFYAPNNIILAIVTRRPTDTVLAWARRLEKYPLTGPQALSPNPPMAPSNLVRANDTLTSEQTALYLGGLLPGARDKDCENLALATSMLSGRLFQTLRERDGLAYSVGASARFDRNFGWYYCSMSTGPEQVAQAAEGIKLEIEKLQWDGPTASELTIARNRMWGRHLMTKLAAINQAYSLAVDALLDRPLKYDRLLYDRLMSAQAGDIRRVASRYFRPEAAVLTTAGPAPE